MSVQVIMKDGRPEWAVIPYEQYEALLSAAGQAAETVQSTEQKTSPADESPRTTTGSGVAFSVEKLNAMIQSTGKSAAALAKDAGISPAYLAQIVAGQRAPSPAIVRGLAQALGIKPDELLG